MTLISTCHPSYTCSVHPIIDVKTFSRYLVYYVQKASIQNSAPWRYMTNDLTYRYTKFLIENAICRVSEKRENIRKVYKQFWKNSKNHEIFKLKMNGNPSKLVGTLNFY